jgi:hypothetical protein
MPTGITNSIKKRKYSDNQSHDDEVGSTPETSRSSNIPQIVEQRGVPVMNQRLLQAFTEPRKSI